MQNLTGQELLAHKEPLFKSSAIDISGNGEVFGMKWESALPSFLQEGELDLYIHDRSLETPRIDCSLGTNPLGTPFALHTDIFSVTSGWATHSYPLETAEFRQAISLFWKGLVTPEEVLPGAGSMEIIFNLLRLFGHPGNTILGLCPQFPDVPQRFRLTGAEFKSVSLNGPDYYLEIGPYLEALTDEVCMAYLDHPHNPTGQAWELEALSRIAERCKDIGALLVVDEAYGASLPEEQSAMTLNTPSVIVLRSFSKIWGLAGLRAGYLVSRCPEFRHYFRKTALPVALSSPALQLIPIALKEKEHLERTRRYYREVKERLLSVIRETEEVSLAATHPNTPIFFVEPRHPRENLFEKLLKAGIRTERGSCYEGVRKGSVRIRIPGPEEVDLFLDLWRDAFHLP